MIAAAHPELGIDQVLSLIQMAFSERAAYDAGPGADPELDIGEFERGEYEGNREAWVRGEGEDGPGAPEDAAGLEWPRVQRGDDHRDRDRDRPGPEGRGLEEVALVEAEGAREAEPGPAGGSGADGPG